MNREGYCENIYSRKRNQTREVHIAHLKMGGENPIRIQSMTTVDTMDLDGSVEQSIRMIDAGCEMVRITAPSKKEAEQLKLIRKALDDKGYNTPIVADIHFTPNAAEIAAKHIEKVRINPGNYADKKKFENLEFTSDSYKQEIKRIEDKLIPLIQICKEQGTSIRIGTNHGSLSDRILSQFGDTPKGMVESAMEYIRICHQNDFYNLVISMKASNTLVMVYAYRLLICTMKAENLNYPLHLGVTEAGDGEDGRIKSAVGIGALLEDGIGDTIRVSLTEAPEKEIPVAKKLITRYNTYPTESIPQTTQLLYDPYSYNKRQTTEVQGIGGRQHPVVVGDLSNISNLKPSHLYPLGYRYDPINDKWHIQDTAVDYLYLGKQQISFSTPGALPILQDYKHSQNNHLIVYTEHDQITAPENTHFIKYSTFKNFNPNKIHKTSILVFDFKSAQSARYIHNYFLENNIQNPVILYSVSNEQDAETYQLHTASKLGINLIDGFGDGIWLNNTQPQQLTISTAFGILQATRTRISKTEYISCPSCGRTLFDLETTTQKIRKRTSHLKGIKIGIMGCIVNGPGEMADADYGYVGSGPQKINLYKEKEVIKRNVHEENAVDELINLIKDYGDWVEP